MPPSPWGATATDPYLQHSLVGEAQSSVGTLLPSFGSWCTQNLFLLSKSEVSVSPSPVEVLQSNPTGHQTQIPWGFLVLLHNLQAGNLNVELRIFTIGAQNLHNSARTSFVLLFSLWVAHAVGVEFNFIVIGPLLQCCSGFHFVLDHGYLFVLVDPSVLLLMVVQQLAVIWVLSQEKMKVHSSTLPS